MKYNVLSYDPVNESMWEMEWRFRARNVGEAKAKEAVDGLLRSGYDRDMSICVDQADPYSPDVELPSEKTDHELPLFKDQA